MFPSVYQDFVATVVTTLAVSITLGAVFKQFVDLRQRRRAQKELDEAERHAYQAVPESILRRTQELAESQTDLEQRAKSIQNLFEESRSAVQLGSLFNVYSKQIEKYQTQTQARAGWSFIFAIVSMVAGLALVVWGGTHILSGTGWEHVAAGSVISTIGGAASAYITKTFLDVHKLSLVQLNHYFRQPVLNAHILTAQRLADLLGNDKARQKAYETVIAKIADLIASDDASLIDIYGQPVLLATKRRSTPRKSKAKAAKDGEQV